MLLYLAVTSRHPFRQPEAATDLTRRNIQNLVYQRVDLELYQQIFDRVFDSASTEMTFDDLAIAMSSNAGIEVDSILSKPSPYMKSNKLTLDNLAMLNNKNNPYEN